MVMNTAVDAPGEAPSNATSEQSAAATSSVPKIDTRPWRGLWFGLLLAVSPHFEWPTVRLGARIIFLQGGEAVMRRLQNLADEIFGQIEIVASNRQQRSDIGRPDRLEQGHERAILEEFGGKARMRHEQERELGTAVP